MKAVEFHFDFGSPNAYLSHRIIPGIAQRTGAAFVYVPVLLGGHSETPLPLFSYLTILNLAILFIAWKKSWRPLNLLGFFATFILATAWGFTTYEDRHFAICEAFLIGSLDGWSIDSRGAGSTRPVKPAPVRTTEQTTPR